MLTEDHPLLTVMLASVSTWGTSLEPWLLARFTTPLMPAVVIDKLRTLHETASDGCRSMTHIFFGTSVPNPMDITGHSIPMAASLALLNRPRPYPALEPELTMHRVPGYTR